MHIANDNQELKHIAHYQLQDTLGSGALGTVYKAWDSKLNRIVALKVLTKSSLNADARERFHREARAIAALKHPNIVEILDYSDADSMVQYIALELLEGKSLFEMLHEYGPMHEQIALCIGMEISKALDYAHKHNVIHRDIKPENVILEKGRVVLIDFGAMRLMQAHEYIPKSDMDTQRRTIGTPGFMAPEQFLDKRVDHRSDIYATGALLYNITTGMMPYSSNFDDVKRIHTEAKRGNYRDPRDYQALLSPAFVDLLADCLERDSNNRISNAQALQLRIADLLIAHGIKPTAAASKLVSYSHMPSLDQEHDLRSVTRLMNELKLALLRDFQTAVKSQNDKRITQATNRLKYLHSMFDLVEGPLDQKQTEKKRFLHGRSLKRKRWYSIGIASILLPIMILIIVKPDLFVTAHEKIFSFLKIFKLMFAQ